MVISLFSFHDPQPLTAYLRCDDLDAGTAFFTPSDIEGTLLAINQLKPLEEIDQAQMLYCIDVILLQLLKQFLHLLFGYADTVIIHGDVQFFIFTCPDINVDISPAAFAPESVLDGIFHQRLQGYGRYQHLLRLRPDGVMTYNPCSKAKLL